MRSEDNKLIIGIAELLFVIIAAALLGAKLLRRIMMMVGDNQNVQAWLASFTAGNPYARHLLRLLHGAVRTVCSILAVF